MKLLLLLLHLAAWAAVLFLLWLWLRKELTPKRFLSIFETDGTLSSRQILAWVIAIWALGMRSADRITDDTLRIALEAVMVLFGIGGLVRAVDKYKPSTTVNAGTKEGDVNLVTPPPPPGPE
ncbi:MAG TPA: hypothetical protein VF690_11960 [Hymenobacter sp.]|jgi:hypothetical protein